MQTYTYMVKYTIYLIWQLRMSEMGIGTGYFIKSLFYIIYDQIAYYIWQRILYSTEMQPLYSVG